jgi:ketosteroid isomerase-like protein
LLAAAKQRSFFIKSYPQIEIVKRNYLMNKTNEETETGCGTLSGIIRRYYGAYESKDKAVLSGLLTDDFTFTSPNDDDHIDLKKYFEKCWPEAGKIDRFDVEQIIGDGDEAFVRYQCLTTRGQSFSNAEHFKFENGKIKEIEVFFGAGQGFASNEN